MNAPLIAERPAQAALSSLPVLDNGHSPAPPTSPPSTGTAPDQPRAPSVATLAAQPTPLRRPAPVAAATAPVAPAASPDGSAGASKIVFNPRDEQITTLIAASQRLKGTLQGPEGVMVKGTVDGDILIDDSGEPDTGTVVVFEGAVVNGTISGRRVIVFGTVNGPIISRTSLTIAETGTVNGDVYYNRMINSDGGTVEGHLRRIKDGVDPLAEVQARSAKGHSA